MNINQFKTLTATVLSVEPTNTGIEIWGQYEGGREVSYRVNDPSFSARQGHQITAILYGVHPVALLNRTTNVKIQLLNGYDLLGQGPEVKSRSGIFWVLWVIFMIPFSFCVATVVMDSSYQIFGHHFFVPFLANLIGATIILGVLFGIPFWNIVLPRFKRRQHRFRIKQADAAIAQLFNPL